MRKLTLDNRFKLLLTGSLIVVLLLNAFTSQTGHGTVTMKEPPTNLLAKGVETSSLRAPHASNEFNIQFITKWGSQGTGDGQFDFPSGVAVNSSGYVYVTDADPNHNHVQIFTPTGTYVGQWGSWGIGDGQFNEPYCVAVNNTGYVYVVDSGNARVQIFTPTGTYVGQWGSQGAGDGQFNAPRGIAVNSTGYVYVVDTGNARVQIFTPNGSFVGRWGSSGTGDGQFNSPFAITVASSGEVYVADSANRRVQVFTSDGTFLRKWGSVGAGDGQFFQPFAITVDSFGYVYVPDGALDRFQIFRSDGTFLTKWEASGSGDGQLNYPTGIAVYAEKIYVADTDNFRVQAFSVDILSQLHIGLQDLFATNHTINVTFCVENGIGAPLRDVLLEISNSTHNWADYTNITGQHTLELDYTPNEFTLEVNGSKNGYLSDNDTFVIYIDPPAVDYTPPVDEYDPSTLATFGMFAVVFVGPWIALTAGHWTQQRKKNGR